jgi:putative transposase
VFPVIGIRETMRLPGHVHLFVQYPPELSPSTVVERIKSNTSRDLRLKYPHLVKWNKDGFWATGCFHGSVGQGFDVVERYIKGQRQFRGVARTTG